MNTSISVAAWGLVAALASPCAWCQIYRSSEAATGSIVLSNFKADDVAELVVGSEPGAPPAPPASVPRLGKGSTSVSSIEIRRLVDTVAAQTQVSAELIHAVILAESAYNANAVSNKGAIGLMQLLPATGKRFGASNLFSAEQNVFAGARYLKWLMGEFGDNLELVLAAYNAGEQAVRNAGGKVPPFPETRGYVKAVLDGLAIGRRRALDARPEAVALR